MSATLRKILAELRQISALLIPLVFNLTPKGAAFVVPSEAGSTMPDFVKFGPQNTGYEEQGDKTVPLSEKGRECADVVNQLREAGCEEKTIHRVVVEFWTGVEVV